MINTVASIDDEMRTLIRGARMNRQLSQAKLAEFMNGLFDAGWFQQTVQKVESGDRKLSAGEFIGVVSILDVDVWRKQ